MRVTWAALLAAMLCAHGAGAAGGKKGKASGEPELPTLPGELRPAEPDLPELPSLDAATEASKSKVKRIDAQPALPELPAAPAPLVRAPEAPVPAPAAPAPDAPRWGVGLAAALAVPGADLDLAPSYALELGYALAPGGAELGLRAGYALLAARREVMLTGRGLDKNAFQSSHVIPLALYLRAPLTSGRTLTPYVEAGGGVGVALNEVHAFGQTDTGVTTSPEVAAALGMDWRPETFLGARLFARLRSSEASLAGRAAQSFLRTSLSAAEIGAALDVHF